MQSLQLSATDFLIRMFQDPSAGLGRVVTIVVSHALVVKSECEEFWYHEHNAASDPLLVSHVESDDGFRADQSAVGALLAINVRR